MNILPKIDSASIVVEEGQTENKAIEIEKRVPMAPFLRKL